MFTSLEEKIEVVLENNPSGTLKGHIATLDKRDIVHHSYGEYSGSSELWTYVTSFSLETAEGTFLVKLNRRAPVTLRSGTEVWVAGTRTSDDRFEAEMVVLPALQQVLDLRKQTIFQRFIPFLLPVMMVLVGLIMSVTAPDGWAGFAERLIGTALMMGSVTVGCLVSLCVFKKNVQPKNTKYETWEFIKSRFT